MLNENNGSLIHSSLPPFRVNRTKKTVLNAKFSLFNANDNLSHVCFHAYFFHGRINIVWLDVHSLALQVQQCFQYALTHSSYFKALSTPLPSLQKAGLNISKKIFLSFFSHLCQLKHHDHFMLKHPSSTQLLQIIIFYYLHGSKFWISNWVENTKLFCVCFFLWIFTPRNDVFTSLDDKRQKWFSQERTYTKEWMAKVGPIRRWQGGFYVCVWRIYTTFFVTCVSFIIYADHSFCAS